MVKRFRKKSYICAFLCVICFFINIKVIAYAQEQTIKLVGSYRHPYTNIIEDSGGENSFALGQSMVEKMVDTEGKFENEEGKTSISFMLKLMSNISEVELSVQAKGNEKWMEVKYKTEEINKDTTKFVVPVSSSTDIIRAKCFVKPMGRSVIFYISNKDDNVIETIPSSTNNGNINNGSETKNNFNGLIIGGPDVKVEEEGLSDNNNDNLIDTNNIKIDNSVWITLFMLIFSVVIITGVILIVVYMIAKKIIIGKQKVNKGEDRIFDITRDEDIQDIEDIDLSDVTIWGDEDERC